MFARRVHITLGWALLVGICASLNIFGPNDDQQVIAMERAAVATRHASPNRPHVVSAVRSATPITKLPPRQRVVAWFTRYDSIRREAQMTPAEKANAIRLWAMSSVAGDRETEDARAILTSMVVRYERAQRDLRAVPEIAETASLHRGYLAYFKRAHSDFSRYLNTLETKSTRAALLQMENGRQDLAEIDVRNKSLDRRLRKHYKISDFTS